VEFAGWAHAAEDALFNCGVRGRRQVLSVSFRLQVISYKFLSDCASWGNEIADAARMKLSEAKRSSLRSE
jgi:hypothetical protein